MDAEALGSPSKCQYQTIGLDGASALDQRCPEHLVRDPRLHPPSLRDVELTHRVAWLPLLPRQRDLEPPLNREGSQPS